MILGNVKIGANAEVLSDVPAGATAVGVPARVIEGGRSDAK
jgi:serine O-acetyltransferase